MPLVEVTRLVPKCGDCGRLSETWSFPTAEDARATIESSGGELDDETANWLQDADGEWYCANCRTWCDGDGCENLTKYERPAPGEFSWKENLCPACAQKAADAAKEDVDNG